MLQMEHVYYHMFVSMLCYWLRAAANQKIFQPWHPGQKSLARGQVDQLWAGHEVRARGLLTSSLRGVEQSCPTAHAEPTTTRPQKWQQDRNRLRPHLCTKSHSSNRVAGRNFKRAVDASGFGVATYLLLRWQYSQPGGHKRLGAFVC